MKPTTNANTIFLLEEVTTTRRDRIHAAHDRHQTQTVKTIRLFETYDQPPYTRDAMYLYQEAGRATSIATGRRYRSSGQTIMHELRAAVPHELKRFGLEARTIRADELTAAAANNRKNASSAKGKSEATTRSDDEKVAFVDLMHSYRLEAEADAGEAHDIRRKDAKDGHTDTADLIQEAVIAAWLYGTVDSSAAITAAGRASSVISDGKGYGATRTKVKRMNDKQLAALCAQHPSMIYTDASTGRLTSYNIPVSVLGRSTAYLTLEYRNTRSHPDGYYLVTHYHTAAKVSLNDFAKGAKDDEEASTLFDTMIELAAYDESDAERDHEPQLIALMEAAAPSLTAQQREIMAYWTGWTSGSDTIKHDPVMTAARMNARLDHQRRTDAEASAAERAGKTRTAKAIRSNAARLADAIEEHAALDMAMTLAGVTQSTEARWKCKSRIKARFEAAAIATKYWSIMDDNSQTAAAEQPQHIDLLTAQLAKMEQATIPEESCEFKWTRRSHARVYSVTPAQREQEAIEQRKQEQRKHTAAEAAKAAHIAAIAAAEERAADWFIKPAKASATVFEAVEAKRNMAVFDRHYDAWEAKQKQREATQAAQEAEKAAAAEERRNRYNAALKASLDAQGVTWAKASAEQRKAAREAAEKARG